MALWIKNLTVLGYSDPIIFPGFDKEISVSSSTDSSEPLSLKTSLRNL